MPILRQYSRFFFYPQQARGPPPPLRWAQWREDPLANKKQSARFRRPLFPFSRLSQPQPIISFIPLSMACTPERPTLSWSTVLGGGPEATEPNLEPPPSTHSSAGVLVGGVTHLSSCAALLAAPSAVVAPLPLPSSHRSLVVAELVQLEKQGKAPEGISYAEMLLKFKEGNKEQKEQNEQKQVALPRALQKEGKDGKQQKMPRPDGQKVIKEKKDTKVKKPTLKAAATFAKLKKAPTHPGEWHTKWFHLSKWTWSDSRPLTSPELAQRVLYKTKPLVFAVAALGALRQVFPLFPWLSLVF